jgi:hypothetical protein
LLAQTKTLAVGSPTEPEAGQKLPAAGWIVPCIFVFVVGFLFSTWLLDIYRGGDQEHYDRFWRAMVWTHPSLWERLQVAYLSSAEPLYRLIIGVGTYYNVDRIGYLSAWNAFFLSLIAYALIKFRSSIPFAVLVFTNFYVLVLLSSAERLKFGYIFLLLAFCVENVRWKAILSVASGFAHTQAVIQFFSAAIYYVAVEYERILSRRSSTIAFMVGAPASIGIVVYYLFNSIGDIVVQKSEFYMGESEGIPEIVQWFLILIGGTVVLDRRWPFFLAMLPMGVLTSLFGGRVNVATLAFFCALAMTGRKTAHPLVLFVMAYMSFKSIGFITNVLNTGQGF